MAAEWRRAPGVMFLLRNDLQCCLTVTARLAARLSTASTPGRLSRLDGRHAAPDRRGVGAARQAGPGESVGSVASRGPCGLAVQPDADAAAGHEVAEGERVEFAYAQAGLDGE